MFIKARLANRNVAHKIEKRSVNNGLHDKILIGFRSVYIHLHQGAKKLLVHTKFLE